MTFTEDELKILESIPAGKKQDLLQFAAFLKDAHEKVKDAPKKKRDRPRLVGVLEGKVWMSEDFNDPLEFVSSSEMHVLEAMRTQTKDYDKKPELQEVAV